MAQYYTTEHPSLRLVFSCTESLQDPSFVRVLTASGFTIVSTEVLQKCEVLNIQIEYQGTAHAVLLFRPLSNIRYAVAYFYGLRRAEFAMTYHPMFLFVPSKHLYFLLDDYENLNEQFFEEICQTFLFMLQPERQVKYLDAAGQERIDHLISSNDLRYISSAIGLMMQVDPEGGVSFVKEARGRSDVREIQEIFDRVLEKVPAEGQQPLSVIQMNDEQQPLLPFFACYQAPNVPIDESVAAISAGHELHEIAVGSLSILVQVHALQRSEAEFSRVQVKGYAERCYALYVNGTDWKGFGDSVIGSSICFLPEELLRSVLVTTDQDDFLLDAAYGLLLCTTDILIKADGYKPRESLNYQILEQVKDRFSPAMKEAMAALIR